MYKKLGLFYFIVAFLFNSAMAQAPSVQSVKAKNLVINGKFVSEQPGKIYLYVWRYFYSDWKRYFTPLKEYSCYCEDGRFNFSIDSVYRDCYITIGKNKYEGMPITILDLYLASPGDSIWIEVRKKVISNSRIFQADNHEDVCSVCDTLLFSGNGVEKYRMKEALDRLKNKLEEDWYRQIKNDHTASNIVDEARRKLAYSDYLLQGMSFVLGEYQTKVEKDEFNRIKRDCYGNVLESLYGDFHDIYQIARESKSISRKDSVAFLSFYNAHIHMGEDSLFAKDATESATLPSAILRKEVFENELLGKGDFLNQIQQKYDRELRERLILNYLVDYNDRADMNRVIEEVLPGFENGPRREFLLFIAEQQKVGTPVYDFALKDSKGGVHRLSDFKGKILFMDFWFTGCWNCADYFNRVVLKLEQKYRSNPAIQFITISIDGSESTWKKSLKSELYASRESLNLIIGEKGVNHPLIQQLQIIGFPHPLLVDKGGNILSNDSNLLIGKDPERIAHFIDTVLSSQRPKS